MTTLFLGGDDAATAAAHHRAIADDLDRLAAGGVGALDPGSVRLEAWTIRFGAPVSYLQGTLMDGSPRAQVVRTGNLVALDLPRGWARSWSTSYRLGVSAHDGDDR